MNEHACTNRRTAFGRCRITQGVANVVFELLEAMRKIQCYKKWLTRYLNTICRYIYTNRGALCSLCGVSEILGNVVFELLEARHKI